jgi:hypothetical protein
MEKLKNIGQNLTKQDKKEVPLCASHKRISITEGFGEPYNRRFIDAFFDDQILPPSLQKTFGKTFPLSKRGIQGDFSPLPLERGWGVRLNKIRSLI